MAKRKYSAEEIIHKRREADVLLGQGKTVLEVAKQLGIVEQTYVVSELVERGLLPPRK